MLRILEEVRLLEIDNRHSSIIFSRIERGNRMNYFLKS